MNPEAQRIAIAEACGVTPKRMWRVWYDAERQHASICIPTKREALDRAAREEATSVRLGYEVVISEPEEYDEWEDAPDYLNDLNPMHEAEIVGIYAKGLGMVYLSRLHDIVEAEGGFEIPGIRLKRWHASATAAQRAEAFLRTLNLWKP